MSFGWSNMAAELQTLAVIYLCVSALMAYARWASSRFAPGVCRLVVLLPPILVVPLLPFYFSAVHLRGIFGFFLGWLAVFKLLLLAFDSGPLHPSLPLLIFISTSSLPVKLRDSADKPKNPSPPPHQKRNDDLLLLSSTSVKLALLGFLLPVYSYKDTIHYNVLILLYGCHMYLSLELVLACTAALTRALVGMQLEPQFNAPYLATSLQDFWGRRWNLMVTGILRPSVYNPVRARLGTASAVIATFFVSGVMHELMVIYLAPHATPSGELTCFFVLHGLCMIAEKKAEGRWGRLLHPLLAPPLVIGFVLVTAALLFFPPFLRPGIDVEVLAECATMAQFIEGKVSDLAGLIGLRMQNTTSVGSY